MYQDCSVIDIVFVCIKYIFSFCGRTALKNSSDFVSKQILSNFALQFCSWQRLYSDCAREQFYLSEHVEREFFYHCEIMFNVLQREYKNSYNYSNL